MNRRATEAKADALVIRSTKTGIPLLDPFDLAADILAAINEGATTKSLAEKYDLSDEMIREFRVIGPLKKSVSNILIKTGRKRLKDIAYRISTLESTTIQLQVARFVLEENLDAKTVREIVGYLKYDPKLGVDKAYLKIKAAKLKKINRLVIPINERIINEGEMKVDARFKYARNTIRKRFGEKGIGLNAVFKIDGPFIIIDLDNRGLVELRRMAKENGTNVPGLFDMFLTGKAVI